MARLSDARLTGRLLACLSRERALEAYKAYNKAYNKVSPYNKAYKAYKAYNKVIATL